jgi:DNA/RNA-binding domain of Phe-tRNA-synthetase-like protein
LPDRCPAFRLSDEVRRLLRAGLVRAAPVSSEPSGAALIGEMEQVATSLAERHAGRAPSEVEELHPARDLYRAFRIDPTRTRPSSESLFRRALQGKPLPRILGPVDLCNLLSLQLLLPLGLYDAAKIAGDVTLRRGRAGESYPGIRKEEVHLEGRPVLADSEGPFGNPTSDSLRTSVTSETRSLWLLIFAPAEYPLSAMEANVARAREMIQRHLAPPGGSVLIETEIAP